MGHVKRAESPPQLQADSRQVLGGFTEFPHRADGSFLHWTEKHFGPDGFQVLQLREAMTTESGLLPGLAGPLLLSILWLLNRCFFVSPHVFLLSWGPVQAH